MNPKDPYWDDLGLAWRAMRPELESVTPRLQARLRRQSFAIVTALALGIPLCAAAIALGGVTIWQGWATGTWNFVTRGVALASISALLLFALASFLPYRRHAAAQALSGMLEMAIARIRRARFMIRASIAACAIAVVFGIAGAAIRTHAGSPPRLSPIVDLILVGLLVLCLWLCERAVSAQGRKFEYLRRTLEADK
jgi:hypothetical protein